MIPLPIIDIDIPIGWNVVFNASGWRAIHQQSGMYIMVAVCDGMYGTTLCQADGLVVIDIQSPDLSHVIPSILRFINLSELSSSPDILSSSPDTENT